MPGIKSTNTRIREQEFRSSITFQTHEMVDWDGKMYQTLCIFSFCWILTKCVEISINTDKNSLDFV